MRDTKDKITTREKLAPKVATFRAEGKIVGFTSGAFDILHEGHVTFFEEAKKKCDVFIVGINTDESVQSYKGPDRPFVPEVSRTRIVAALESVDYVFTFGERRNRDNLEILKPSLYIKAGDYTEKELTSADVVKKYGGDILLIPVTPGFSTTNLVKKIAKLYGGAVDDSDETIKAKTEKREPVKAILVDRDGVINEDIEYLHEPEKFKLLRNAGEGLKAFQDMGYKIAVVTLQAGIGLGYFTKENFYAVNREMFQQLKPYDVMIDKIYFVPHGKRPDGKNPKLELVERARGELDLDLSRSIMLGDKTTDIEAGKIFGMKTIGVKTGAALGDRAKEVTPDYLAGDLLDAANWAKKQASES